MRVSRAMWVALVCMLLLALVGGAVHWSLPKHNVQSNDIYFSYVEGGRLLAGENPYGRVAAGNMRDDQKYATYVPGFYLLSAITRKLGLEDYLQWITFWRWVWLGFNLGSACVIFYALFERKGVLLGLFGALFWLLNRWTLHLTQSANLEYFAIFFLLLSLFLFERHKTAAFVLLGISLSVKQVAILAVPLYLIWAWQSAPAGARVTSRLGMSAKAAALIASVPVVLSLPFIFWNAEGFGKSMIFEAVRNAAGHVNAPSLDSLLGQSGIVARMPLFGMLVLVYAMAWLRKVRMYTSMLLAMAVFVDFGSVLFLQYFCWLVPFIPLAVCDLMDGGGRREKRLAEAAIG